MRTRLFEHVQNLPAAYFARTKRGEILSRFSIDMSAFEGSIKSFANSAALPFLELIAGIILMLFLNWQLAAMSLLVFPITLIGPRILTPKAVQANYEQKLNESALLGMVQENVAAQAVVKAFSLQRRTLGWFTMRNDEARRKIASAAFLSTMVERTVTISVLLLHLVVLAIGAYLATKGQITIGTFVTFESAFWEVSYNIAHLMHFIPVSIQSAAAVRHIQEMLDEPTRGADRPGAPDLPRITNDITFDRVTFKYEGSQTPVLDNFSLKLKVGKSIAIVGPSGSGKSTLLNLILRLYVPDEGRVTIDGVDIRKVTRESLRRSMAVVFQENMLFNMSIRENIRLGKEGATDEEVEEAARKAEIHRYIMSLPQKYDTPVGERGDTLSGGQRQRIAIARAIVRNPSVLLLDEATSALDQTTEAAINSTLLKLAKGRTMILSTHRLTSVVEMDEIIVIAGGKAIERGSHAKLLAANGMYRKLWDDQSHKPHQRPIRPTTTTTMTMRTRTERGMRGSPPARGIDRETAADVAFTDPRHETRPALRPPVEAVVDRQRAKMVGLGEASRLAGLLLRIVVELRDLCRGHAVGRKPLRNVDIAQPFDVGEHLGAGPGDRKQLVSKKASPIRTMPGWRWTGADIQSAGRILMSPAHLEVAPA